MLGNSWVAAQLAASQEGLSSMELNGDVTKILKWIDINLRELTSPGFWERGNEPFGFHKNRDFLDYQVPFFYLWDWNETESTGIKHSNEPVVPGIEHWWDDHWQEKTEKKSCPVPIYPLKSHMDCSRTENGPSNGEPGDLPSELWHGLLYYPNKYQRLITLNRVIVNLSSWLRLWQAWTQCSYRNPRIFRKTHMMFVYDYIKFQSNPG
jgi:hypothetical protein